MIARNTDQLAPAAALPPAPTTPPLAPLTRADMRNENPPSGVQHSPPPAPPAPVPPSWPALAAGQLGRLPVWVMAIVSLLLALGYCAGQLEPLLKLLGQ